MISAIEESVRRFLHRKDTKKIRDTKEMIKKVGKKESRKVDIKVVWRRYLESDIINGNNKNNIRN